jgi:D-lactate dehydrogenase (cytochrome)
MSLPKELTETLSAMLGARFSQSSAVIDHHSTDEAHYPPAPPDAVLFPKTTDEVSQIMQLASRYQVPVVPWGVGTSLEGHALAINGGLTLDMSEMDNVIALAAEDQYVRVQPGVTREQLNQELRSTGLFFPVDPGANATLGGMAATSASGTTAVRYGTMADNVMGLTVVLADGRIIKTGRRAKKTSSGYDLTRLIVGSEGTLGIITELTLRLHGQPEAISAAVCEFPDTKSAIDTVIAAIQSGIPMARIEYLNEPMIKAINLIEKMDLSERPHLFLEFHGSQSGVAEQSELLGDIAAEMGGAGFVWSTKAEERSALWKARHNAYHSAHTMRPGTIGWSTDVCVPISALAQAIEETMADLEQEGIDAPILGHVGDGNYHVLLFMDANDPKGRETVDRICAAMNRRALALGGTITGEHGIGAGKMKFMAEEHGEAWAVMAEIKRALDPMNILNPGKVVQIN